LLPSDALCTLRCFNDSASTAIYTLSLHDALPICSRPKDLPILKIDGDRVWSSDHAVFPSAMPETLAVIGAGAVGMEFADVYASFGAKVTVIEALERVLPNEDKESSAAVEKSFRKRGIEVLAGARLEKATVGKQGVKLVVQPKNG